jgi:FAD:protein FMN transferase
MDSTAAMSESNIHVFNHRAMATHFQARIADDDKAYAEQAAQAAFSLLDNLESKLSRFSENSEIAQIAQLNAGEKLRLAEPVLACLRNAQRMESATRGAFSITAAALQSQPAKPLWTLLEAEFSIRCDSGRLAFDLGAIGKGFALDRMAEVLLEWSCPAFLLSGGGSSVLAGEPPTIGSAGWDCGLGENNSTKRFLLKHASLSGSGLAVKGSHILDPRTGYSGNCRNQAWALAASGAESDALSTACMILTIPEINEVVRNHPDWLVFLKDENCWHHLGHRSPPPDAASR